MLDSDPAGPDLSPTAAARRRAAWDLLVAARDGVTATIRDLLRSDPGLLRTGLWEGLPLYLAVREGHAEAVRVLLAAGADPAAIHDRTDLATVARDRGHEGVAHLIASALAAPASALAAPAAADHPIHAAAAADDVASLRSLLSAEPDLANRRGQHGRTPLHLAAANGARAAMTLLLDHGAEVDALQGAGDDYAANGFRPIDLTLWTGPWWSVRGDLDSARLLLARGAERTLAIAAALGDLDGVTAILDHDPARIGDAQPSGKRPLSAAIDFGHDAVARLLLARGADPTWRDGANAVRGAALHSAARRGDTAMVELLLAHGADPNAHLDSSGSATYVAATPALRALLTAHGGRLDPYDLVWLNEDDAAVARVAADPGSAAAGCGSVFAAVCTLGKRDLLERLIATGARVPAVVNGCRSYLWSDPAMLRRLLDSGMDPDLPDRMHATPLHDLCSRDGRGRPRGHRETCAAILLDAGAALSPRDEDYRSTPLAWAARNDLPDMVEFLLGRGAPVSLPDDPPWATPLAWALRRGHHAIAVRLRAAGA